MVLCSLNDAKKDSIGKIPAVSVVSIASLFDATEKFKDHLQDPLSTSIKSPLQILNEGQTELRDMQSKLNSSNEQDTEVFNKTNNAMLLDFMKKVRNGELLTCIQIITAFMEEQAHIPVTNFHLSVSYWKLWKLGLMFHNKVSKGFITKYVSMDKHNIIQAITDATDHTASSIAAKHSAASDSRYANKLRFLLLLSHQRSESLPIIDEHLPLSLLEDNLCTRFAEAAIPINETTPLEQIESKWDSLFENVDMSTVVNSHRRLVAQWLTFSLAIRKLRENLCCHTTVSIIGLVNSGKSTLVKELFRIEV